jgi:polysaccharide deacetylase 2 family uncharacterized protein YibQ
MPWNGNERGIKIKTMRNSKQPSRVQNKIEQEKENVEYLNYLGSMITNDARCKFEIK